MLRLRRIPGCSAFGEFRTKHLRERCRLRLQRRACCVRRDLLTGKGMEKLKDILAFLALVFFFCFLPFALLSCLLGYGISLIWDVPWWLAAFVSFLAIQVLLDLADALLGSKVGFKKLIQRFRK